MKSRNSIAAIVLFTCAGIIPRHLSAGTYAVGVGKAFQDIGDVPWARLTAGDTVLIHWRPEPYREKWVICRSGTATQSITVRGVPNGKGRMPVIDGNGAGTRKTLNFWNEDRGVIKIGGANVPADTMPRYIVIENLEIRSGRPPYTFTGREGRKEYAPNAASIYLEKGEHITIRNCLLRDSGNGILCANRSSNIVVERCHIYDNGIKASIYQHNSYTEAKGITFQYNRFGPLREGCLGNNLKDRSAGTVIRYNWIEGGNRQLDLVDTDYQHILNNPDYRSTFVYGNLLIKGERGKSSQVCHYGGDSGNPTRYRKGTLYFYNNTVVSTRSDNTTLFRLSSKEESCDLRNNIIYATAPGKRLAIWNGVGTILMRHNWVKAGWVYSHESGSGRIHDQGSNITGMRPGFEDLNGQRFRLSPSSTCIDRGTELAAGAKHHPVTRHYGVHRSGNDRPFIGPLDIGAFEFVSARTESGGSSDGL